jgi:hypothetical protein
MPHRPKFSFRTQGGECAGQQWICDHEAPIARFEHRAIEQPEQELRYFDGNPRPVNLRDLKLVPGGRPLIAGVQLFWVFQHKVLVTSELVDVAVAEQESEALELTVVTRDPGGVATSRRVVTVTYDAGTGGYVYDFACHLEIHSPEVFDRAEHSGFEYCDPWYVDTPGPSVAFPGMWKKRYLHLLAEEADGTVWKMPINHMATGIPKPRAFKRDGLFVAAFDPGNNPAFQFVGETADRTSVGVCNWGYDVHLVGHYTRDELYGPICPCFRALLCPDERARRLLEAAKPVPEVEHRGFRALPIYERETSFEKGLRLNEPSPGDTDPWPWHPDGEGLSWDRTVGRSDAYSLKIQKETTGPSEWFYDREGDGAWTEPWRPTVGFRITGYIRTEQVAGRGSCLAVRWGVYNSPERYPYLCSEKLSGTNDWTKVSVEIRGPHPPDCSGINIILRQDGSGTTWFDDLKVERL